MRITPVAFAFVLAAPLVLAACGERPEGESADDFAARVNGGAAPAEEGVASEAKKQPDGPRDPSLPRVAADGRKALQQAATYTQPNADGSADSLAIRQDGTYTLVEDGRTTTGEWQWLPDGKRLRLEGLVRQPIVLVADGALYRMQNENVPFDDVTPDRAYRLAQ
ncbi:hypothetical protein [Pelagerythrobacter marensis]|uniref:Lipoprotein n=1 Tax=Pelagerythrobacter marensis TaxID=543877 RepID=A0A0G3XBM4_9SPHN|nr:hypothetical protein [Pelagerythrobacter marensis]AKM08552.1 hypothetical protein AM2010_2497 [Pelagerythrobacter marensis]